jgi:hypothetical protein
VGLCVYVLFIKGDHAGQLAVCTFPPGKSSILKPASAQASLQQWQEKSKEPRMEEDVAEMCG